MDILNKADFNYLVTMATKAPSGHNTQPWLFCQKESEIEIRPDFSKTLKIVDPDNRELFISLGCATENLCIAASAKGYQAQVSVSGEGVITIRLTKATQVNINPLSQQISRRQVNKGLYTKQVIEESVIRSLNEVIPEEGVSVSFLAKESKEFNQVSAFIFEGNVLQMNDNAFKNELKTWMRYNKKQAGLTNDGLSYATFGAPDMPLFISKNVMNLYLNAGTQSRNDKKKIESSSHLLLFAIRDNNIKNWIDLGRSLERMLLKLTESGIANAFLNQPCEIKSLAEQMRQARRMDDYHPAIILRLGYAKVAPYSLRKDIKEVIIS